LLLGAVALPFALWLCAEIAARLLILATLQLAFGLTALCLALGTMLSSTEFLWANYLAIWLPALHLATGGVDALATSCANRLVALWSTHLIAFWRCTLPCALWCAAATSLKRSLACAPLLLLSTPLLTVLGVAGASELALVTCSCGYLIHRRVAIFKLFFGFGFCEPIASLKEKR